MGVKLCWFLFSLNFVLASSNPCNSHKKCGKCIQDPYGCQWCSMDHKAQCIASNDSFISCDISYIKNPKSEASPERIEDFSSTPNKVIQIKPQLYRVKLRPGQSVDFDFYFKAAVDYPADLYFLVDNSQSMSNTKSAIADASKRIYEEMKKRTTNVFLGIGTFVDKNALPFIRMWNENFEQTNSYRNVLKLTNNVEDFEKYMNESANGINSDNPEGGLDALAQVIVCQNETGWRPESRKIVIFFTDEASHSAGDGKWAGIVQPFDGHCYTLNGVYTKELEMDYPSIGMINHLASEKEVTVVFIVPNAHMNNKHTYESLKIKGAVTLTYNLDGKVLKFNEMQLENALTRIYEELSRNLKLKVNMPTEAKKFVKISFDPDCTQETYNAYCQDKNKLEKHFKGTVQLLQYYGQDTIAIDVSIGGINEKLQLLIDVIKNCDCKTNASMIINNSEYCSMQGSKICGVCECEKDHYGETCACTADGKSIPGSSDCKSNDTDQICSGRGTCVCNVCNCFDDFNGKYCQCNKNSCPGNCNGHGVCVCGICHCKNGWSGPFCDCSPEPCPIMKEKECNGHGECKCGKCECHPLASWDARSLNDKCDAIEFSRMSGIQCNFLKECALCHIEKNLDCKSSCDSKIGVIILDNLENIPIVNNSSLHEVRNCDNIRLEMACFTQFKYRFRDDDYGIDLYITTVKDCLKNYVYFGSIFLLALLVGSIGAMLLLKWIRDTRDRREFERFLKLHGEDANAADNTNPIYSSPTSTFQNPAFRKRSIVSG